MLNKLKEKFIKNSILYKLYRILKFRPLKSHSAFGEEILVNRIFKKFKIGFYIDVGALNPKIGSTTYFLSKKGWRGLNIDLTKSNVELFKKIRKKDVSIKIAASNKKGSINSYIFDPGSGLNNVNKKYAEKWKKKIKKNYTVEKIESDTLNSIIKKHSIPNNFEYLNIDVESHELKVLEGLNFEKYRPLLITCEIQSNNINEIIESKVYKFLITKKYKLISYYYLTCFFIPIEKNDLF